MFDFVQDLQRQRDNELAKLSQLHDELTKEYSSLKLQCEESTKNADGNDPPSNSPGKGKSGKSVFKGFGKQKKEEQDKEKEKEKEKNSKGKSDELKKVQADYKALEEKYEKLLKQTSRRSEKGGKKGISSGCAILNVTDSL